MHGDEILNIMKIIVLRLCGWCRLTKEW